MKYFKNQNPEKKLTSQFRDPIFPPNSKSLLAIDKNNKFIGDSIYANEINKKGIIWKNSKEIFGINNYDLFCNNIKFGDIKQGSLGNCYFLSALAALCEFPNTIYNLFNDLNVNNFGYYEIKMFIEGEWQKVIIDDYFPVVNSTVKSKIQKFKFRFSKPNGNELWVILLEKAWAKVNGGYRNTISGKESDVFECLTGYPSERYNLKKFGIDEIWDIVLECDNRNNIMCTTTITDNNISNKGLIPLHAYSLIGAKIVNIENNKIVRLVQLRNPWGNKEWLGDWSDKSSVWDKIVFNKDNNNKLNEIKDNGMFYMSIEDYVIYFNYICICSLSNKSTINYLKITNNNEKINPTVYVINLNENSVLGFSAVVKHWRYTREIKCKSVCSYIIILKLNMNTHISNDVFNPKLIEYIDSDYSVNSSVVLHKILQRGKYLLWVWCDNFNLFDVDKDKHVRISISSETDFTIDNIAEDKDFNLLKRVIYIKNINNVDKSKNVFCKQSNMFEYSGFGYRLLVNNSKDCITIKNNYSNLLNMDILPSYKDKNILSNKTFYSILHPNSWDVIIANKLKDTGSYSFNLKSDLNCTLNNRSNNILKISSLDILKDYELIDIYNKINKNNELDKLSKKSDLLIKSDCIEKEHDADKVNLNYCTKIEDLKHKNIKIEIINDNKSTYKGYVNSENKKHGKGILINKYENISFVGEWKNDLKHGYGYYFNNINHKIILEGNFNNNTLIGNAKTYLANGDVIICKYIKGKKEGPGKYIWNDNSQWKGTFKNDKMHGIGILTTKEGLEYDVEYNEGNIIYKN